MCMLMALCKLPRYDCLSSSYFFTHPISFKVYCRHRINNLYNTRWGNIKLLLHQLPRSDNWCSSHFFTHLILLKADCLHRINNLYNTRWRYIKLLLHQLPRSGWSVGRAGLGAKAIYPVITWRLNSTRP